MVMAHSPMTSYALLCYSLKLAPIIHIYSASSMRPKKIASFSIRTSMYFNTNPHLSSSSNPSHRYRSVGGRQDAYLTVSLKRD